MRSLYEDDTPGARRARDVLLGTDIAILVFVIATSFAHGQAWLEVVDGLLGALLLAELAARLFASRAPRRDLLNPWTWVDMVAIASFLAPVTGEAFGFLRALRLLRVLRLFRVLERLREIWPVFRRNEEAVMAAANLAVFIFVMTGMVYATQHRSNPHIANYADALYFTITSLTTTGFGDITLPGTTGRMLSVVIMLAGVTLFLRLAQALFRPSKVRHDCPSCGLMRHEPDAVHCKACGVVLNIPDEGH
ncbi:two pore domain potassium channel family protein [Roseomonas nepalensis]|uniref:Two pore domain potassium channel family protein n=1 Tax=Muricoccus nepalensis TaxID=1854500 RepID=A0A502G8H1_9PROT|nr:two pore domain potassium channel family protein [Roseomonas nepalensis]